jgi:hypothetical protein
MKIIMAFVMIWIVINGVVFINSWNGGRTSVRYSLKLIRDVNIFIVLLGLIIFTVLTIFR